MGACARLDKPEDMTMGAGVQLDEGAQVVGNVGVSPLTLNPADYWGCNYEPGCPAYPETKEND
jgi:hypothetical protein